MMLIVADTDLRVPLSSAHSYGSIRTTTSSSTSSKKQKSGIANGLTIQLRALTADQIPIMTTKNMMKPVAIFPFVIQAVLRTMTGHHPRNLATRAKGKGTVHLKTKGCLLTKPLLVGG